MTAPALNNPLNGQRRSPRVELWDASGYLAFRHCSGFRVEWPDGEIGFVEDVLFGSDPDRPAALAVRCERPGGDVEIVALEAVEAVYAGERRIRLQRADGSGPPAARPLLP